MEKDAGETIATVEHLLGLKELISFEALDKILDGVAAQQSAGIGIGRGFGIASGKGGIGGQDANGNLVTKLSLTIGHGITILFGCIGRDVARGTGFFVPTIFCDCCKFWD